MEIDSSLWTGIGFNVFPHMAKHPEDKKPEAEHERDYDLWLKEYRIKWANTVLLAVTIVVAAVAAAFAYLAYDAAREQVVAANREADEAPWSDRATRFGDVQSAYCW